MSEKHKTLEDVIVRRFTTELEQSDKTVYDLFAWKTVDVHMPNYNDGRDFKLKGIEFPIHYSQNACNIIASRYFVLKDRKNNIYEKSLKEVVHRMVNFWKLSALDLGLITDEEAVIFYDELAYMMLNQMFAPNSPQWFNTGLKHAYGISGKKNNLYHYNNDTNKVEQSPDAYSKTQASACFITNVKDTLLGKQSLSEQLTTETKLFKFGSGVGSNWSTIRGVGEKLSSGGTSSGVMSFLKTFDVNAGAIKSGGTCLAPMQKIMTEDGAKTVKELAESDEEFTTPSYHPPLSKYVPKKATAWKSGQKEVYEITTTDGKFYLSYDHPIFMNNNKVILAKDLKEGMEALTCNIEHHVSDGLSISLRDSDNTTQSFDAFMSQKASIRRINNFSKYSDIKIKSIKSIGVMDIYSVNVQCDTEDDKTVNSGHNFLIWSSDNDFVGKGMSVFNTRRAAKINTLDVDHPEILEFSEWKAKEEQKVRDLGKMGYDTSFNGEAYETVSGQNANNSVRTNREFMELVEEYLVNGNDNDWCLINRTDGNIYKTIKVSELWESICQSAWECGDPALQYDDIINDWHTCPYGEDGDYNAYHNRINASNPCFTGDMRLLTDEGYKTFEELSGRNDVSLIKEDGSISHNCKVWETGVKNTIRLMLSTGKHIDCTPNHVFKTVDNKEIEARLLLDESLMTHDSTQVKVIDIISNGKHTVYDFNEPDTHWGVVEGVIAHNCSEYMFIGDTSCNLASINLVKFVDKDFTTFLLDDFIHAINFITLVLEATIHWGQFPTEEIAYNTELYRTLGLGYANLGSFLMSFGLGYDSNESRNIASGISSIMTAQSYKISSLMAKRLNPFNAYDLNKTSINHVLNKHKSAIDNTAKDIMESYTKAHKDNNNQNMDIVEDTYWRNVMNLLGRSVESWEDTIELVDKNGLRNAQVTLLAPTGTISLAMDCASTSSEPFFSHVVWKQTVDNQTIVTENPYIEIALDKLGYDESQINDIINYVLRKDDNGFVIDGNIEFAPHIKKEDLAVFDTANRCGTGKRALSPQAHVKMMAAIQPHLSGAISKTVNLPRSATVEDISEIYYTGWKYGLKSIALFRDGCKASQPLTSTVDDKSEIDYEDMTHKKLVQLLREKDNVAPPITNELVRIKPQGIRKAQTHEARIDGQTYYVHISYYEDGEIAEIYISGGKEGSLVSGLLDEVSRNISVMLQYGISPKIIAKQYKGSKYEPSGVVTRHPYVKMCTSLGDLISRIIEVELGDYSRCQVKPDGYQFDKDIKDRYTMEEVMKMQEDTNSEVIHGEQICTSCGSDKMIPNGTCFVCITCGETTGCS